LRACFVTEKHCSPYETHPNHSLFDGTSAKEFLVLFLIWINSCAGGDARAAKQPAALFRVGANAVLAAAEQAHRRHIQQSQLDPGQLQRVWELHNRLLASEAVTRDTLFREETRWPGCYYRSDHPKLDDQNWHCFTLCRYDRKTGDWAMEKAPVYQIID
jgi:succinate dehydrogenase/fumarate reductase flavoprotein subunit